jgi:hypothetical protein
MFRAADHQQRLFFSNWRIPVRGAPLGRRLLYVYTSRRSRAADVHQKIVVEVLSKTRERVADGRLGSCSSARLP